MSRIRTIKPEFFTSEDIVSMQPLARLLYVGLWCEADREGRFLWKPMTFKMRYLAADECDVNVLCDVLLDRGLVIRYGNCACIPTFLTHQHINPREANSKIPAPTEEELTRAPRVGTRANLELTRANLDLHGASTHRGEGKGREGKGREGDCNGAAVADSGKALRDEIWTAYSNAYFERYKTEPVRNAKVNAQVKQLADSLGQEAPHVAAFYVSSDDFFCVKTMHSMDFLVKSATGLRTQWVTGRHMTGAVARNTEQLGSRVVNSLLDGFDPDERI